VAGKPLRLLVVSQHYWPESFRINSFVETLIAAGADVAVLTGQPNYPAGETFPGYRWYGAGKTRHPSGYDIYRVPLVPRGQAGALRLALNYLSFILAGWLVAPILLRGRRFDALFVYGTSPVLQGFVGLPLRRLKRARLVLWVQDLWPHVLAATGYVRSPRILRLIQRLVGWLYRRNDLVLAQSEAFVEAIRPHAGGVPVRYFPNPGEGADANLGQPAVILPDAFNVVFAGNLGRAQSLDTVVEAATLLRERPDIRITLFGSGAMEVELVDEIERRGLDNLILGGRLPPEAMAGVYVQADALLLTLVDDEMIAKTIPSKLQSYLAAGVPVIAATGGEAARIVAAASAGLVCPPEDASALAAAIVALRDMEPSRRSAMGVAAREHYRAHFDPELLARSLLDQLTTLPSNWGRGR
jgi:glycosyltransferase involved in cell wall biosynthesis